jgi:hypothetical protein
MTNVFKTKSRFASLVDEEEIEENKKNHKEKTTERPINKSNYDNKKREEYSSSNNNNNKFIDEKEKKIKEEQKKIIINDSNFPTLTNEKTDEKTNETTNETTNKTLNFIDKVKTIVNSEEELLNEEYIPPGYLVLKRDKNTNKIIRKYGEMPNYFEEKEITPSEIIDKLVYLYEKRKEEYINLWGEEEYEKMFLFNNYDYYYFDKLDLQYEEELKKINYEEMKFLNDNNDYYNDHYFNNKYDD